MQLIRAKDYDDMSRKAAGLMRAQLALKPCSVFGLATGSSPLGTYRRLIDWYDNGEVDFLHATSINLDEYLGLDKGSPQSYHYFMQEHLFNHINIPEENTHLPNGMASDAEMECARYTALISQCGGIDMQLLGIGANGHIGFNEPCEYFEKDTHLVALAQSTIEANTRFFQHESQVPRKAYTMGIRGIMQARAIVMIASGEAKADIVKAAFTGPVTPAVPASILQLHSNVFLVADVGALSKF